MRFILVGLTLVLTSGLTYAATWADPFINPIKLKEKSLLKLKEQRGKVIKKQKVVNMFKSVIPKPLGDLSIQGVIASGNAFFLVVYDPETGETYMLKEGDAISPSEKIVRITPSEIVVVKYVYQDNKLGKVYKTVKVNPEG